MENVGNTPEEILKKHVIAKADSEGIEAESRYEEWKRYSIYGAIVSAMREYGGLKPRWVKASERLPEIRKRLPIKYDGEPMGGWFHEDGYWVTNHGHEKDFTKILWLDEK